MSRAVQIKDFPDYYITDVGDVYSRKGDGRFRKLKLQKNLEGYMQYILYQNGKPRLKRINRLTAIQYCSGEANNEMELIKQRDEMVEEAKVRIFSDIKSITKQEKENG